MLRNFDFCFANLNGILTAASTEFEHLAHLQCIFESLLDNGLILNVEQYRFLQQQAKFLGHSMDMVKFCRRFLPKAAQHQALLNAFLF